MSRSSDSFNAEMDFLWRTVGEAQDATERYSREREKARAALEEAGSKAARLERELARSREREEQLKQEADRLRASVRDNARAVEAAAAAAGNAAKAGELKTELSRKDSQKAALEAGLDALKAEAAALRETLAARDAAIDSLKARMQQALELPELARTLKEEARLSGRERSVYDVLMERVENGKRSAAAAAAELNAAAAREKESRAALEAAENELSALRAEASRRRGELSALQAALEEAAGREKVTASEKAALEGRAAQLERELAGKARALEEAASDCAALGRRLDEARMEAERLRQAADEQGVRTQEQKNNFAGAVGQVFELQKRAAELRSELEGQKQRNAALAAELRERDADIEKVNGLLRDAKADLAQEKEAYKRAGLKIKLMESDMEALKSKAAASADYAARMLKAVEARDLRLAELNEAGGKASKRITDLELENEDLRRKSIKFSGFLKREQTDFNTRMIASLERSARDLKTFNLRIPAAERKALEPAMKDMLASLNLLKGWQEYLDPETPEMEETDLTSFVTGETGKWERAFKQKKISIAAAVITPRLRARLSQERVKMAFYHLIKNAYERLPRGGGLRVSLKASEDGRLAVITFEDNGPGFPKEALEKLYAPFNTTDKGRAGIGLAVACRIAEKHGGTLEARNGAQRGAVVELRLPLGGE